MTVHVMLDLETLSAGSNAAIIAIGAVTFEPNNQSHKPNSFYRVIDVQSCEDAGLHISASTVVWWMGQSQEARDAIIKKGDSLVQVLQDFSRWYKVTGAEFMWGNGSDFDNVILGNAFNATKTPKPWSFSKNRCFRTLKGLFPGSEPLREGTHHNALYDAKHQAAWALNIFKQGAVFNV